MSRTIGLIGHPVGHSISPRFQGAALQTAGLDVVYEAWDTPEDELADRVAALRDAAYLGANVTIPHKQAVIPMLDDLGDTARRVGAVNTIVNDSGRLIGHNTDGHGFVEALRKDASFDPSGQKCLLLGAGGAARAIAFALLDAGAELSIQNRTRERAEGLVGDLSSSSAQVVDSADDVTGYACVINTTSVGMDGTGTEDESPSQLDGAAAGTLVVDIVYNPDQTALLKRAADLDLPTLGGVAMLIRQGARSFTLWTGEDASVDVMFAAAHEALGQHSK